MPPTFPSDAPLVSIIITYYNRPEYICDSVKSALQQTHKAIEVIVVDHSTKEEAHQALRAFPNLIVVEKPNGGLAVARNQGLEVAKGEYVIFLDDDDRLVPDAIALHLHAINGKPKPGLIFGAIRGIDQAGHVIGPVYVCLPRRNYFLSMLECNLIRCPAAAMLSHEAILAVGCVDPEVDGAEDNDLYLRLARKYPVVRHTEIVAENRIHSSNATKNMERVIRITNLMLDKMDRTMNLNAREKRHLNVGRARVAVYFGDQKGIWPKLQRSYFRLRSLLQSY